MKYSGHIISSLIIVLVIASCQTNKKKGIIAEVSFSGALRTIMSGDIQSTIRLDSLSNKKNLYALGAVENLRGEVQIFDSEPSICYVDNKSLQIDDSYSHNAALLVYAEVEEWDDFILKNISTKDELEETIFKIANSGGINNDDPFPFLLNGQVASLDWHVINWKEGDTIHNHKKHKESGLNGTLQNREVQIIGFYSTKHKAIFTHHTTNMHMHFKTNENTIAGHIDDLSINKQLTLKLPRQ